MSGRLKLEDVTCEVAPARVRARVQLRNSGLTHVGLASNPSGDGWQEVVAQATLNAVRMFVGFAGASLKVTLESVQVVGEPHPLAIVTMTLGTNGAFLSLVGSAALGDDPRRAIAKAVLQAVNRQVERIAPPDLRVPVTS